MREALEMYKGKADSYLTRLEATEVEKVKATRGEAFGKYANILVISLVDIHSSSTSVG
jgi:hypothetical protein